MNNLFRIIGLLILILVLPYHMVINKQIVFEKPLTIQASPPETLIKVAESNPQVVLVTIDGVRWQDIFDGTDPHLFRGKQRSARELVPHLYEHFVDNGMVVGKDSLFVASGPMHISLPGYLEIMRGHPSIDCQSNDCEPKLETTIADLFDDSAVFGSWETISKAVSKTPDKFVVNCGRRYRSKAWKELSLPDNSTFPESWSPRYRPDTLTQVAVLDYLKIHQPQFLWVSLGDTDEWAHAENYKEYLKSLMEADKFIDQLMNMYPNASFIVTADHGRGLDWSSHGIDAESARDWFMMSSPSLTQKGFIKFDHTKSLSNIFPTIKCLISGKREEDSLI